MHRHLLSMDSAIIASKSTFWILQDATSQNPYGTHLRAESKWCALNKDEPLGPSLVTY